MMPNVLQHPVGTVAVLRAGYAVVNVNPLYTPRELEYQLKDSGAEAIIVLDSYASVVQQVIAATTVRHVIVGSMIEGPSDKKMACELGALPDAVTFHDAIAAGHNLTFAAPKIAADDVAFLQYTGGTTGVSERRCFTATFSPTYCRTTPGCSRSSESRRTPSSCSSSARCPCITSSR